ncbi:metallophosphatase domain-containing protein [Actinomadura violacea]|uniref:Metallophosphatase domain-containing protein n=1 Tax=Actinomadura violacea TaxID=2819934 RepID=A0ABS3RQL3_9ACTN|nr:metallophosphatase domain-containing protein [Actinomadura violacea]MBO2458349.1 metallophosphatase domain-containing protein [Actinomadura violacea]
MRIVAVADTHTYHRELTVPEGDVLVHAGDLCRRGEDLRELEGAADWLHSLPHRTKIVVAGNHDRMFADRPEEARAVLADRGIHYLQDGGMEIDGVGFWGSPWQPEFNDWAFNLPRGRPLAEKWALIPERVDVLVTHGPPLGIGDAGALPGRHGCADLLARVRRVRPRLHLFGHIHHDGGLWHHDGTTFANVTTWECERAPTVIRLDPSGATGEVVPAARAAAPPP